MLSCGCCYESEGWVAFLAIWLILKIALTLLLVNLGALKLTSAGFALLVEFLGTFFAYLA